MRVQEISSKDNPVFRNLKTLLTSKGIKEENKFFLMGEKLIHEFLKKKQSPFHIKYAIGFDEMPFPLVPHWVKLKKELFNEIDILGTHYPLLVLEYKSFHEFNFNEQPEGLEIVSPLGDPKNLGSLLRSAAAFGASKVILTRESCHPYLPHSIKSSAGAALDLPVYLNTQPLNLIPMTGTNVALDLNGESLQNFSWPENLRLWVGEEGPGLQLSEDQKKKIKRVTIPTQNVESLNATVSTSLALWEWKNRKK